MSCIPNRQLGTGRLPPKAAPFSPPLPLFSLPWTRAPRIYWPNFVSDILSIFPCCGEILASSPHKAHLIYVGRVFSPLLLLSMFFFAFPPFGVEVLWRVCFTTTCWRAWGRVRLTRPVSEFRLLSLFYVLFFLFFQALRRFLRAAFGRDFFLPLSCSVTSFRPILIPSDDKSFSSGRSPFSLSLHFGDRDLFAERKPFGSFSQCLCAAQGATEDCDDAVSLALTPLKAAFALSFSSVFGACFQLRF